MNWNEKAKSWAVAHGMGSLALGPVEAKKRQTAVMHAARWQRDQLRTDEAVERVADALCVEEEGMTLAEHEANCELPICGFRQSFLADARRNITALLGED